MSRSFFPFEVVDNTGAITGSNLPVHIVPLNHWYGSNIPSPNGIDTKWNNKFHCIKDSDRVVNYRNTKSKYSDVLFFPKTIYTLDVVFYKMYKSGWLCKIPSMCVEDLPISHNDVFKTLNKYKQIKQTMNLSFRFRSKAGIIFLEPIL